MPRVLVGTAWAPTKSHCFPDYSRSLSSILAAKDANAELFITACDAASKYQSIVGAMCQMEGYAIEPHRAFTHYLNVEMDRLVDRELLERLLSHDKDIVIPGLGTGKGLVDPGPEALEREGRAWAIMLVKVDVLREVSFKNAYRGDFLDPSKMWFKLVQKMGYKIWVDEGINVHSRILERETPYPTVGYSQT